MSINRRIGVVGCLLAILITATVLPGPAEATDESARGNPSIQTTVPDPTEMVFYDTNIAPTPPAAATAGSLTSLDRYGWYCFKAILGVPLQITVVRTAGGLLPNCGLMTGVVDDGDVVAGLGPVLAATNSLHPDTVTLNYTPLVTGTVSLFVSGANSTIGDYTVTMSGGEQRQDCLPCPACVGPGPPIDTAVFKFGDGNFLPNDQVAMPLLVDVAEAATFTQVTVEYNDNCVTFVNATVGGDVTSPGIPFVSPPSPGAVDPNSNTHVLINLDGEYTGCENEVLVLTFEFTPGFTPPCRFAWDPTIAGPNSNNHLNYTIGAGGTDGKILPDDIIFCDGEVFCDNQVEIEGTVLYYSNGTPVVVAVPDPGSAAVIVKDCNTANMTTNNAPLGDYLLPLGPGPVDVDVCAIRPIAVCGTDEDGVIGGDDLIVLQDSLIAGFADPKQQIAADVNKDTAVNLTDLLAIKRWIARKVCDGTDVCGGANNNCAATWRFLFFDNPNDPDDFTADLGQLFGLCFDDTLNIEGVLLGDVDGSWPDLFLKPSAPIALDMQASPWQGDEIEVALHTQLNPGESLRHIIYSLDYDATQLQYLGLRVGADAKNWDAFDNPDQLGSAHGIAHKMSRVEPMSESGEVVVFRFRALTSEANSEISFSRLKANDVNVARPSLQLGRGSATAAAPLPTQYSLRSQPNPFNPATRVHFTIPKDASVAPVSIRVYDIAGRLVNTLLQDERGPGYHYVDWNGRNTTGKESGAGVYLVRIQAGDWSSVEKVTLIK